MKNNRAIFVFLSLVVLFTTCLASLSPPLVAQSTYGSIAGAVTDPSGGAIVEAQVTLTNLGTAEKRLQPTGSDGLYSFVSLCDACRGEASRESSKVSMIGQSRSSGRCAMR